MSGTTSANTLHVSCPPYPAGRKSAAAGAVISTIGLIGVFIACLSFFLVWVSSYDTDSAEKDKKLESNKIFNYLDSAFQIGMIAAILTPFPLAVCSLHTYRVGYVSKQI